MSLLKLIVLIAILLVSISIMVSTIFILAKASSMKDVYFDGEEYHLVCSKCNSPYISKESSPLLCPYCRKESDDELS